MRELADGVWQLRGSPANAINVYLVGDVLVDAGTKYSRRRILRQLAGRKVSAHALTHAHPDHQGSSHAVCEVLGIPLWCGAAEVEVMQTPGAVARSAPPSWQTFVQRNFWTGPSHPVARALREGDEVAGFVVRECPGHAPGHIAFWRESDRVLVIGDVLTNVDLRTGRPGLHEPLAAFTPDPARNRESAHALIALEPQLVCFGHGPPLRDPRALSEFGARLPA
jgi:glyoxylase-like metal-dependent hydrolase (beta-lactamase superfamily II)